MCFATDEFTNILGTDIFSLPHTLLSHTENIYTFLRRFCKRKLLSTFFCEFYTSVRLVSVLSQMFLVDLAYTVYTYVYIVFFALTYLTKTVYISI